MAKPGNDLPARVAAFTDRHAMLVPGDRVAVAVSGGSDSVALLLLLAGRAGACGLQLSVAHFDHRWRAESAADTAWVEALAQRYGLACFRGQAPSPPPPGNREQTARRQRYAFFHSLLAEGHATRIATGHTLDDQAETVMLRILRGAGPTGLAGILARRDRGRLVRPLLSSRRAELRVWLRSRRQDWLEDPANAAPEFARSRLRHSFLPELSAAFNPNLVARLASLAEVAAAEEEFWGEYLRPLLDGLFIPTPHGGRLARAGMKNVPLAVQRRLLRAVIAQVKGDLRQVDFAGLEEILAWLASPARNPRKKHWAGLDFVVTAGWLEVAFGGNLKRL